MQASGLTAKLIQRDSNRDAIKPGFDVFPLRLRIPGQFEKNFDGEFLGTSVVANHAYDDACNALVLGAE